MKSKRIFYPVLILLMVLMIPLLGLLPNNSEEAQQGAEVVAAQSEMSTKTFNLLDYKTGQISEISLRDYLIGVVAAEMPVSFETEALKAQTVASHTYALHQVQQQSKSEPSDLHEAVLTTDPSKCQAFSSDEECRAKFGSHYDEDMKKITDAVDAVLNIVMTYDNQPIVAAFHSMSSGMTESAEDVWGGNVPYLQPVDSAGDLQQQNYESTVSIDYETTREKLVENFPQIQLSDNYDEWFIIQSRTPSDYVDQIQVGNITATGTEIRSLFGLRSADFTVSRDETGFIFTTKGNGHGVGMSQYGANAMAQQGHTYDQILLHYYQGVTLTELH